jgi:transcriptional regulator with XRE-family HTH domain
MAQELTEPGKRLLAWLEEQGQSQVWLAAQLGVARAVLWRWLAGKQTPRVTFAVRIERLTGGAVPVAMWSTDAAPVAEALAATAEATGTDGT